jgi:hypothetical protein
MLVMPGMMRNWVFVGHNEVPERDSAVAHAVNVLDATKSRLAGEISTSTVDRPGKFAMFVHSPRSL